MFAYKRRFSDVFCIRIMFYVNWSLNIQFIFLSVISAMFFIPVLWILHECFVSNVLQSKKYAGVHDSTHTISGVDLGGIRLSRAPQIRRHRNPARLPSFAATWGPDFRASIIRLTCPTCFNKLELLSWRCSKSILVHQIKYANLYATKWNTGLLVVYSAHGFLAGIVCFDGVTGDLLKLIIAIKSAVNFPTELTLAWCFGVYRRAYMCAKYVAYARWPIVI